MATKWTNKIAERKKRELEELYTRQNKTIFEIAGILKINYRTVFDRLQRLKIKSHPFDKTRFRNQRNDIKIPQNHSEKLAEFLGILLGDGHISPSQIIITVNNHENEYLRVVSNLITNLFGVIPHTSRTTSPKSSRRQVTDVYLGSTAVTRYFLGMGLASNKVRSQVDVPSWVTQNNIYSTAFIRGFFDTDGSVYRLKHGTQVSFKNASLPLLRSTQKMLRLLKFFPSRITNNSVYLTRRSDLYRFFTKIQPKNKKHINRAKQFHII